MTRRTLVGSLALAAAAQAQRPARPKEWKPKLGVLGPFTEANVAFAHQEGLENMILAGTPGSTLDATKVTDAQLEKVKRTLTQAGISVSAFQATQNHINPDLAKRAEENDYFVRLIAVAGQLGIRNIGTASGKDPDPKRPFQEQVDDIVRVYTEKYFPACEKFKVRILWEPWAGGPNLATGPVGFAALLKGFGNNPYVGLQYDPSHLVWQMMDPIQAARDFVDHIYDVHLKDTEVHWHVLRHCGINPPDHTSWWRFRLPGLGSIDWPAFFTVLQDAGYEGALTIEHEDPLYGSPNRGGADFTEDFKTGVRMAHRYLRQYVPVA
jgi:sugar phosphate isomerase/epimerase